MAENTYPRAYNFESSFKVPQSGSNGPSNVFRSPIHPEQNGGRKTKRRSMKLARRAKKSATRAKKSARRAKKSATRAKRRIRRRSLVSSCSRRFRKNNKIYMKGGSGLADSTSFGFHGFDTLKGALAIPIPISRMNACIK